MRPTGIEQKRSLDTQNITKSRSNPTQKDNQDVAASPPPDWNVQLSELGQKRKTELETARSIATQTPDIREERVAKIKNEIASGNYVIDAGKVADGILREAIKEKLATMQSE